MDNNTENQQQKNGKEQKQRHIFRSFFSSNRVIMILSFIIAFALWTGVSLSTHTEKTIVIEDVPINYVLPDTIQNELGLNIIDTSIDNINVSITGNAYIIGQASKDDFNVTAKFQDVTGSGIYDLSLDCVSQNGNYTVSSYYPASSKVRLDRTIEKEYAISIETNKYQSAEGYNLSLPTISNSTVLISGPESDMKKISRVVAQATVDDTISETKNYVAKIVLYDSLGQVINNTALKLSFNEVDMTIIARSLKTLQFSLDYVNLPTMFSVNNITMSPSSIEVAAQEELFESYKSIPLGELDFSNIDKSNNTFHYDVHLPTGVINQNSVEKVDVTVNMYGYSSKNFEVKKIQVINTNSDNDYTVLSRSVTIRLTGPARDIESLSADDIVATISAENVNVSGQSELPISIQVGNSQNCWVYGKPTAFVQVSKKNS